MKSSGRDFLVYLAGPISGLTYEGGQGWRNYVTQELPEEIRCMSPLRAKGEVLTRVGVIDGAYEENPLTSQAGITTRDRLDCTRADAVLFNFLGATSVSIGTVLELGWADAHRIPIIVVMEPTGNLHDHPMIRAIAGFRVTSLDAAVVVLTAVLLPEGVGTPREIKTASTA